MDEASGEMERALAVALDKRDLARFAARVEFDLMTRAIDAEHQRAVLAAAGQYRRRLMEAER